MKITHYAALCFIIATTVNSLPVFGWGAKGHDAIAHIAQEHLSRRAERRVTQLLEGHDMAYWASWADGLRDDHRYDALSTWHYANADEGYTYASAPKNPAGDVYTAVELCIDVLEDRAASDSLKALHLKLLIHFVGDMHCPMHAGHASDRGGNGFAVDFRGESSNLHRLWDSQLIDAARQWSAFEWGLNVDYKMSRRERRAIAGGDPLDWMEQTVALSHQLYLDTPRAQDGVVGRPYINSHTPLIERKFVEAGHRLARLLNDIFGC
jgi:hypothetical protein